MEFDENSKNCHLSQGSEQEFVTILLPIGEEIRSNSDGPILSPMLQQQKT